MRMKYMWHIVISLGVIIAILLALLIIVPANAPTSPGVNPPAPLAEVGIPDVLKINSPKPNTVITSPLMVAGTARGTWFFEASFPVKIFDSTGYELGVVPAQAKGDWMTTDFVNFSAVLSFNTPTTATGTLVFEKDNPSGLPQNAQKFEMPVKFK